MSEINWTSTKNKLPEEDRLFLVTPGNGFVEIAYFENGNFKKPYRFDSDDTPACDINTLNEYWYRYIGLYIKET